MTGQVGLARQRIDPCKLGIERALAQLIDARFVHEGREEIAELLLIRAGGLAGCVRSPLDDRTKSLLRPVDGFIEAAVRASIRRDLRLRQPCAVDELVEVVLRTNGLVEAGRVDASGQRFRGRSGGGGGLRALMRAGDRQAGGQGEQQQLLHQSLRGITWMLNPSER
jgi:hypothetical protein